MSQIDYEKETADPPVSPARQARGERTRRRVLDAVLRLIARGGIHAVTFRAVAAEADVSLGVTTYYFASREDMLAEACALHLHDTHARSHALQSGYGKAWREGRLSREQLTEGVLQFLRGLVHEERDSFVAGHELGLELIRNRDLAERLKGVFADHREVVGDLLAQAGSTAPELDGEILAATFEGLALKWLSAGSSEDYEARLRLVIARLLERFVPDSEA